MMSNIRISKYIFIITIIFILISQIFAATIETNELSKNEENEKMHILKIINDPCFVDRAHGVKLIADDEGDRASSLKRMKDTIYNMKEMHFYKIIFFDHDNQLDNGSVFTLPFDDGECDLNIRIPVIPGNVNSIPDWDQRQQEWDSFVNKFWPDAKRLSSWQNNIKGYDATFGTFSVEYDCLDKQAVILRVSLNISLENGKITGLYTNNYRPFLHNSKITDPPAEDKIIEAVKKELIYTQKIFINKIAIINKNRLVSAQKMYGKINLGLSDSLILDADNKEGKKYTVYCSYDETNKTILNLHIIYHSELNSQSNYQTISVEESTPNWSDGGDELFVCTNRFYESLPWWQKYAGNSFAKLKINTEHHLPEIIRPMRVTHRQDILAYSHETISPSEHYLAGMLNTAFLVIDMKNSISYVPSLAFPIESTNWMAHEGEVNVNPWSYKIGNICWLPDDRLLISVNFADHSQLLLVDTSNIASASKLATREMLKSDSPLMNICISASKNRLVYTRQEKNGKVMLHYAEINQDGVQESQQYELPAEVISIANDEKNNRWLMVFKDGSMCWATLADELKMVKIPPLQVNGIFVQPVSVAIAPKTGTIAIAGLLGQPLLTKDGNFQVYSTIFTWDGQGTTVKYLYDQSGERLPIYQFPNGSRWTTVKGDLKAYHLDEIIDQ